MIPFEVNIENAPPSPIMRQWSQIYEVKTTPQMSVSVSIEDYVKSVHIHSDQTIDLTV